MRTIRIGRDPENDIVYNVSVVSGKHAVITITDDGQIVVTDSSTNGTWINGAILHNASAQVTCMDQIVFPGNILLDWNLIVPAQAYYAQQNYEQPLQPCNNVQQNYAQQPQQACPPPVQEKKTGRKGMFAGPFSFDGRIRRLEYGLTMLICWFASGIPAFLIMLGVGATGASLIAGGGAWPTIVIILGIALFIGLLWFQIAQNAKRCHDLGHNGAWQLIPFYFIWMLFVEGDPASNRYGENPKQ